MTVIAKGILNDRDVALRLEDGVLTGDRSALLAVRAAISGRADVSIAGVVGGAASLEDEWMAVATFRFVLPGCEIETDAEPYDVPEGAIA